MSKTPCKCPLAGWCPIHRRNMHPAQHAECRDKPMYFEAYNQGVQERQQRGLGDSIAEITHKTGIAKALQKLTGKDCGCKERQDRLNQILPYKAKDNTTLGPS